MRLNWELFGYDMIYGCTVPFFCCTAIKCQIFSCFEDNVFMNDKAALSRPDVLFVSAGGDFKYLFHK